MRILLAVSLIKEGNTAAYAPLRPAVRKMNIMGGQFVKRTRALSLVYRFNYLTSVTNEILPSEEAFIHAAVCSK